MGGRVVGLARLQGADSHEGISLSLEGTAFQTTTPATGDFRFEDVPAGQYELVASKVGYVTGRQSVAVKAGESLSLSMSLARATSRLDGKVLLLGASSHEGITVALEGSGLSTQTAADGGFLLEAVPTGTYELVASKAGYVTGRQSLVVEADSVTIAWSLARAVGQVSGSIGLDPGSNYAGTVVSLEGTDLSTTTALNSTFDLHDVPTGTYVLTARKQGYVTGQTSIVVTEGKRTSVSLTLQPEGAPAEGIILLQGASSHEGTLICLMIGDSFMKCVTSTDETGAFRLGWDMLGTFDLVAFHDGYVTGSQRVRLSLGNTVTVAMTLALETEQIAATP